MVWGKCSLGKSRLQENIQIVCNITITIGDIVVKTHDCHPRVPWFDTRHSHFYKFTQKPSIIGDYNSQKTIFDEFHWSWSWVITTDLKYCITPSSSKILCFYIVTFERIEHLYHNVHAKRAIHNANGQYKPIEKH